MSYATAVLLGHMDSLGEQIAVLHNRITDAFPFIDRMACALYDPDTDLLRTFINSTRDGVALRGYEFKLSDSPSLSELARTQKTRVLGDIPLEVKSPAEHARWVAEQGYLSSFTVPMFRGDDLLGFIFFDAKARNAFPIDRQIDLLLYCSLISMSIQNEVAAVSALVESIRVARDLTQVRDFETGKHLERMARYARLIAKSVAQHRGLSDEFIESVTLFSPLHDIGKIGIPDKILLKPGHLNDAERAVMKTHVERGVGIIDRIIRQTADRALVNSSILHNIVACHHEYLDGSGYPHGLKGAAVPIEARIVTVADIYDALTAKRPYKVEWTQEAALAEIQRMTDLGRLDPICVQALHEQRDTLLEIQSRYADAD